MTTKLGRLEKIGLRDIWKTEASDFTPWLAKEENLNLLGDTIGIDLELEAQEKNVGPFKADILCKDTADNSWVLIENQLELTDHTHLGQILTYASGLNAVSIVWISQKFTDEHRATLDWLNDVTGDSINFFGLEIELWKISDSPVAPKFNIVVKPNEWTKGGGRVGPIARRELTPTTKLQLEYWTEFRKYILGRDTQIKPQKAAPQHWMNFSIGRSDFWMYAFVDTQKHRIGVRLGIGGQDKHAHFHLLFDQKEAIENEMGEELVWNEFPDKKTSYISIYRKNVNPKIRSEWEEQHKDMLDSLERFHKVFAERIKSLDAGNYQPEEIIE